MRTFGKKSLIVSSTTPFNHTPIFVIFGALSGSVLYTIYVFVIPGAGSISRLVDLIYAGPFFIGYTIIGGIVGLTIGIFIKISAKKQKM